MTEKQIKLIIEVPENLVCKGFEQPFTDEERQILIRAIGNGTLYKENTGEWIMQRHDIDGCFYTCSNCGRMIRVPLFIDDPEDNETLEDYPYCHCGAKMSYKR